MNDLKKCGPTHDLPFAYGPPAPVGDWLVPENERGTRCELTGDICLVDNQFYIVGSLELPLIGSQVIFSWDVWVSLSFENMKRTQELWESESRVDESPYFGWLSSALPCYPETVGLKTNVHTREVGRRPFIKLEATNHPLAVEQRNGITIERVKRIAEMVIHPQRL